MKWPNPVNASSQPMSSEEKSFLLQLSYFTKNIFNYCVFQNNIFTLTFPFQVVNLQDIDAFTRSADPITLLLSILRTTARKCCYSRFYGVYHFVLI
jgi:hypothetical protein